ncbi:Asp-tRNA(Asn)/Glu-tRNA(Gln) amidotransferase GatCAB subunit C [Cohaesibacter sp. CAU 1516]|uniref:molybdopterin-dependent oxidoreductase n=1 Tax=Cohaesibacter sp. CAU 1516 TaxID=2576038 RepID=UPI0010FD96B0|nr:molybdopterin-dependent oxidoreductase [Cohaesibacter sp. CAU 1516]TLP44948.1 Asp-tRNA(Asn)/Glu-tRNA(Gln) amidotransferase GatCAB subunit C [Cohaesibacter sp. CAU 1516]
MKLTAAHWGTYEIKGDQLHPVKDDPEPSRIGKGWVSAARDTNSRILRPAIRKGWLEGDKGTKRCDDVYVEVSWEQAAKLVAGEVRRVVTDHGNEAIFGGSYGWASAGRFHHSQSQLRRFLNLAGGSITSTETYSHAAAEVLFPYITGLTQAQFQEQTTSWLNLIEHCTLLVGFGGISGRTGQVSSSGLSRHETESWMAALKGRKINISPQQSDMTSGEWLSIRPGTDVALMLALCHTLLINEWHDEGFLERCTSGWPTFRAYLLGEGDGQAKSADWAAPICDIPTEQIIALAKDMATNRTLINVSFSLQRSDHGEQALWAGWALAAMIGQIGQPGGGFGFGYSGVGTIGRPTKITRWPSLSQGKNAVKRTIPVARITDMLLNPGGEYFYKGHPYQYPDIKLIFWSGGNPFHHHQDLHRLQKGWQKPDTVVVCDHSWTATARRADIVLPATSPLERTDIMMQKTDPSVIYMSPMFEPLGDAKDDFDIMRLLSAEMGYEQAFSEGRDAEGWLRILWEKVQKRFEKNDFEVPDFESFKAMGRFELPDHGDEDRVALADFVKDPDAHPLGTESGKLTLFNETIAGYRLSDCPGHPSWIQPIENLTNAPDGALHLISAQPWTRLHSQNDRGAESVGSKREGREICFLHPETAKERGIKDGGFVRIFNERGATLAAISVTDGMRRDCISLPTGAWLDIAQVDGEALEVHGNPNVLTIDKGTSGLAQGNIAHTTLVFVESWDKPLPPLSIDKPPRFVDA